MKRRGLPHRPAFDSCVAKPHSGLLKLGRIKDIVLRHLSTFTCSRQNCLSRQDEVHRSLRSGRCWPCRGEAPQAVRCRPLFGAGLRLQDSGPDQGSCGSSLTLVRFSCIGLNAAIQAKGKEHVGTALTLRDEPLENAILENDLEIGAVTPENALKWESTEPERGVFTFDDADRHVNWAVENGKNLRCHTLVWHSQLAPWVEEGNFDNATLIEIMADHINAVAGRYKGKCTHWDVVNEGEFSKDRAMRQRKKKRKKKSGEEQRCK